MITFIIFGIAVLVVLKMAIFVIADKIK